MKQIEVLAGDNIEDVFAKAFKMFNHKEAITFHHNGCQIIIMPDNAEWMVKAKKSEDDKEMEKIAKEVDARHKGLSHD